MGLSDESTGEPTEGPMDGTAVKLVEGHPSDDELTEGHPSNDELTEGHPPDGEITEGYPSDDELTEDHPPDDELVETITVQCLSLGQESPLGSAWEEDRVVIHASEDEMAHWC